MYFITRWLSVIPKRVAFTDEFNKSLLCVTSIPVLILINSCVFQESTVRHNMSGPGVETSKAGTEAGALQIVHPGALSGIQQTSCNLWPDSTEVVCVMRQSEAHGLSIKVCGPHIISYGKFMRNHTTAPVLEESYIVRACSLETNTCWHSSTQIYFPLTSIRNPKWFCHTTGSLFEDWWSTES